MKVFKKVDELTVELENIRKKNLTIGFVPTMGALHMGHLSLVNQASLENDIVLISIFVNPTQFNNSDDLKNYPRNLEKDLELLKTHKCDLVFAPGIEDIYPDENSKKKNFDLGNLSKTMEGKFRPSHFDGVATVVNRLFEITKPSKAYFGQKDIQQFLIINKLNENYLKHLNIQLVKCPIIREESGLAMSSRNELLDHETRKNAALIGKVLMEYKNKYKNYTVSELKSLVVETINHNPYLKVEYFEIATEPDLEEVTEWTAGKKIIACIAVFAGNVRLIDNVYFN